MADLRTTEQDRVAQALKDTAGLNDKAAAKKYFNEAAKFGPMVIANGLAGALAFAVEKAETKFADHLQAWVAKREEFKKLVGSTMLDKLSDTKCDAAIYRRMTHEALAYTNWLKRLAGAKK